MTHEEIDPAFAGLPEMSYPAGAGICGIALWIVYSLFHREKRTQYLVLGNWYCGLGILSLLMSTVWFPWDFLTRTLRFTEGFFGGIQYTWRFLGLAGVFSVVTSMCFLSGMQENHDQIRAIKVRDGLVVLTMLSAMWFIHSYCTTVEWKDYSSDYSVPTTAISGAEYLPKEADRGIFASDQPVPGDEIVIENYQKHRGIITFTAENGSNTASYVDVPFLYYHGYVAKYGETGQRMDGSFGDGGRTRVMIPAGYHGEITVQYRERTLWRLADLVSVLAAASLLLWKTFSRKDTRLKKVSDKGNTTLS